MVVMVVGGGCLVRAILAQNMVGDVVRCLAAL